MEFLFQLFNAIVLSDFMLRQNTCLHNDISNAYNYIVNKLLKYKYHFPGDVKNDVLNVYIEIVGLICFYLDKIFLSYIYIYISRDN